jgi:hypothetical protein
MKESKAPNAAHPSSHPWLALGLTFVLLGTGYALPFSLVRQAPVGMWSGAVAPDVLNLYALAVFAGWAHFVFAFRGQWQATTRFPVNLRLGYWLSLTVILAILAVLRAVLGVELFSALAWIWFIGHFVRAEVVFASHEPAPRPAAGQIPLRIAFQPVLAFAWLSLVLFNAFHIQSNRWILFLSSLSLCALMLAAGGWRNLSQDTRKLPAIAFFFLGESLVWGTYGPYMSPAFRVGVYVFHVAGASFFHYLGSYAFGRERTGDRWLAIAPIVAVNLAIIALGWFVSGGASKSPIRLALTPVLGVSWFTLWVAFHQAASDLLPVWKRMGKASAEKALSSIPVSR